MKKGFTLIELLVVVAIIGILATVVIINVAGAKGKANNAKALADMNTASKVASQCIAENGDVMNGAGTPAKLTTTAGALTAGGNICSAASGVSGTYPVLGLKASNNLNWAMYQGLITTSPLDFNLNATASANPAAPTSGDFRVTCKSTGCTKEQYTTTWSQAAADVKW